MERSKTLCGQKEKKQPKIFNILLLTLTLAGLWDWDMIIRTIWLLLLLFLYTTDLYKFVYSHFNVLL